MILATRFTFAVKDEKNVNKPNLELGKGIKFCLNCDDMDELAFDAENGDVEVANKRFQNCKKTGNFNGDICSRMYVATEGNYSDEQFNDPKDE